jgi:CBS domain-containing protein
MRVEQLMTTEVVTVPPETSLKEVARLLVTHRIAGLPVCDPDGRVVGVVSEADILWKELGLQEGRAGLVDRIIDSAYGRAEREGATTAAGAMSAPPITVSPSASVAQAAQLMIEHRVNRLPVVDRDRLVGIVARADLVRAFNRSDEEIEHEISDDVLLHTLWVDPARVSLVVCEGKVAISGEVENRTTAELIEAYIRRVPGVVSVGSELSWRIDDRARRTAASADQLPHRL